MESTQKTVTPELNFVKLSDLTKEDIKKGQKTNEFTIVNAKLVKSFAKRSGREQTSIILKVHPEYLSQLQIKPNGKYLLPTDFHKILLKTDTPLNDKTGRPITEWAKQVIVRFVKGSYINRDGEYLSIEVIFKQGVYLTHFFTYDEISLLEALAEKKVFVPNWIIRPDKIEFVEESDAFEF